MKRYNCAVYIAVIKQPIAKKMFGVAIRRYCLFSGEKLPRDYDKAAKIYRMGLDKATSDKDVILDRLRDLEEEKK
ncbi:hypothetical protein C5S35_09050 [Candidatus Methanophagaceae archaeon]|nr:hypothetical protein C5S35_09050 [Methanophagales archaeon]